MNEGTGGRRKTTESFSHDTKVAHADGNHSLCGYHSHREGPWEISADVRSAATAVTSEKPVMFN